MTHAQSAPALPDHTVHNFGEFWQARRSVDRQLVHRVDWEFVVAYYDPAWHLLWIEMNGTASFVPVTRMRLPLRSRERVHLEGEVIPDQGLDAERLQVTVLDPEVPTHGVPFNGRLLEMARDQNAPAVVRGYVERQSNGDANHLLLELVVDDHPVHGRLWLDDGEPVPDYSGQFIEATGVCAIPAPGDFDSAEIQFWIPRSRDVHPASGPRVDDLFARPALSLDQLAAAPPNDHVHVTGRVQSAETGRTLAIRDGTGQVELHTPLAAAGEVGAAVEAIGIPVQRGGAWTLRDVIVRPLASGRATTTAAASGSGLPRLRLAGQALHLLAEEAARAYPVELTGIVTFSHPIHPVFFINDPSGGLCVNYDGTGLSRPEAGDIVTVRGHTAAGGFATMVQATSITTRGHGTYPAARDVTLEHALTGVEDAQWVEMRGFLRQIEVRQGCAYLTVVAAGGEFVMRVPASATPPITVGSVLRARGVCASKSNEKRQLVGVSLLVPTLDEVVVEDAAPADPFSRPLRTLSSLRRYQPVQTLDHQVRVRGTVLYHLPGRMILIAGDNEVLRVLSRETTPLAPGDQVDVVGVPGRVSAQLVLRESVYRRTGHGPEPQPLDLPESVTFDPALDSGLVRIHGTLLDLAAHDDESRLFVQTGSTVCEVVLNRGLRPDETQRWPAGSRVAVTGIYKVQYDDYDQPEGFDLLLRDPRDIEVVQRPSWWTARRALTTAGIFFALQLLGLAWVATLRRRVREQTDVIRTQLENEANLEARHRDIVDNASDFIFTVDRNGCFTSFNPAGEKLTGYARPVALRLTIYDLLDRREARLVRRALARPEHRSDISGLQARLRRRDGSMIWVETSARFIRQHGRVIGVLGVVRDISARKQVEEELKHARDAAEANTRAKSQFLANMSHEIRTPMNGVIGMSNLLLDTGLDEQQRDFAETIRNSAESLLTVLNDILDFSKIEAGRLQFEHLEFPLHETIDDALELLAARAAARNLELAAFLPHDLPPRLRGDPGRLRQVLLNLVGNAVKFTDHGEIVVRVTRASEDEQHVVLRFSITDTGVGIAPEACRHLFQAFHQADNSMTRRFGGTGLGLVISKQIVELMHGAIGVESTPGQGSTFWFTARFDRVELPATKPAAELWSGWHGLVVDDQAVNRQLLKHLLAPHDVTIDEAGDAATALTLARAAADRQAPPRFILLDLQMPDMDGLSLAREIHRDPRLAAVPIVLLASLDRPITPELRAITGVVACLTKPIKRSELYKTLTRHVGRAAAPDATAASAAVTGREPIPGLPPLRVLVAEDNVVNQRLTRLQLRKLGLNADVAADGREVLKAVEHATYDVILMDCQMPELDGFETARRLRAEERHAGLRIIAMTANAMQGDRERCLEAGMDDYLSKPTRLDELRAALERCVPVPPRPID